MNYLKTFVIIATLPILLCSIGYAQTINEIVIENDTVFVMDREFAELVASRFDSLEALKELENNCSILVTELQSVIADRSSLISAQNSLIDNLRKEQSVLYQQIDSYKRTENVSESLRKQLRVETRRLKVWKNTAIGIGVAGVVSSIYLILR